MSTTRIATMKAGRELDAEIAQRAMGWKWYTFSVVGVIPPTRARYLADYEARYDDRVWDGDETCVVCSDALRDVPEYSTDIAAAWQVVEKLSGFVRDREQPWWSVAVFYGQKGQVGCRVYACPPGHSIFDAGNADWFQGDDSPVIAEQVGDSAPHAICLAALAAVASSQPGSRE